MVIGCKWNTGNKFCVASVHYTHDPEKNTPEWITKAKEGISDRGWKREYEINYETFDGKPVFDEFKKELHVQTFDYKVGDVDYVYRGWDFGFHHPSCVFWFFDKLDRVCIRHAILGKDETIKDFGTRMRNFSMANYPNAKWLDAADPAGYQKNDKADFTSMEVLNSLGIFPTARPSHIIEGLEIIRQRLKRRNDGNYGLMIHPEARELIDGFLGGYRYDETREGHEAKEEPLKDGFYDHMFDAFRYSLINFIDVTPSYGSMQDSSENDIMRGSQDISRDMTFDAF